jgi:hypothetical protein
MGIIESITVPLVIALCGAVGKLWDSNNKLGQRIDGLQRSLGKMEGLMSVVRACPIKSCPMRQQLSDLQEEEAESFNLCERHNKK